MIVSFQHKGLEKFYKTGSTQGIQFAHARKLKWILDVLDNAKNPQQIVFPGLRPHMLKGSLQDYWSVWVNGNWRVTFRFIGQDVELVNYQDYH